MKKRDFLAIAFAACALPTLLSAHEFKLGGLTVVHPYAIATPKTAKTAAGYFTVTNNGDTADRLIGIESEPTGSLHETTTDANGVARMGEVEAIDLAPGQTVTLAPRGIHVMFTGLTKPFLIGDKIPAKLVFEQAGVLDVVFNVQSRTDPTATSSHDPAAGEDAPQQGMSHEGMPGMAPTQ